MSSSGQGSIVEAFNRQKKKQQQEQQRSMVQIHRDLDVTIKIEPTTDGEEEEDVQQQQQRSDFGGSGDSPEAQVRTLLDSEHRTSLANPNVEDAITIEVVEEEIAAPAKTKGKRKAKAQGKAQRTLDKFVTVVSTPAKRPRRSNVGKETHASPPELDEAFEHRDIEDEIDDDVADKDFEAPASLSPKKKKKAVASKKEVLTAPKRNLGSKIKSPKKNKAAAPPRKSILPTNKDGKSVFPCPFCPKTFTRPAGVTNHIKGIHEGVRDFECEHCDQGFATKHARELHNANITWTCAICDMKMCGSKARERHVNEHSGASFKCYHCKLPFSTRNDLRDHEQAAHGDLEKPHICIVCEKFFGSKAGANSCQLVHTGKYKCQEANCTFQGRSESEMVRHAGSHVTDLPKAQCPHCDTMLKNEHYLKNHIRQVHGDGPKGIFKCNKCDKAFDRSRYLKLHNLRTHEEKPYSCDECPVSFANLSLLRYHVNRRHTAKPEDPSNPEVRVTQKCAVCNLVVISKTALRDHQKMAHANAASFPCRECGDENKVFATLKSFLTHHKLVHERLFEKKCELCMMVFTCGSSLRTHKKTVHVAQDERKKYPCPIKGCTHVALAKSSLKQHMVSSKHAKNAKRTFKCDLCDQTFIRNFTLQSHIRAIHQGEGKLLCFKCDLCGRGFTYHKQWEEHKAMAHESECQYCKMKFVSLRAKLKHGRETHNLSKASEMMTPEEAATPTLSQRKRKARMECTVCSKLITIIYVKNHMRDAHGIENFKLPKIEPKDENDSDERAEWIVVEDDDEVTLSEEFAINNPDHESVIKIKQEKKTPSKKSPVKKTPVKIKQESAATPTKRNLAGKRLTTSKKAKK